MPFTGEQVVLNNETFLTMLAHELRNPLAPILNAIHVVEHNTSENPILRNSTGILLRQVGNIVNVINDLLEITKIAKGELQLSKKRIDLCALIRKSVEESRATFTVRKHSVTVTLPDQSLWIMGDEDKVKQILSHVLQNAAKFTETGGKISITANHNTSTVNVTVKDTGIGMHNGSVTDVFNLFSRPDQLPHLAHGGGMGIGLTLARKLIELHEGSIEAHSEGIGKGSEFTLMLPLYEVTDFIREKVKDRPLNQTKSLDILVVDDHPDTAESLAILLKMWGHSTRVCHSGIAGLKMARTSPPDVVLLDIGLPGFDGYQVATQLQQEYPNTLLIAITGYGQKVDKRRSMNAGFHTHLVKPVSPEQLKEALLQGGKGENG